MRHICRNCMDDNQSEEVPDSKFPKFIIFGGILGAVTGLFVGQLVLIPASLIAGALLDSIQCDICGKNDKNVFEIMEQTKDNRYMRVPLKQFEDPNPLDDQIWIDETMKEFYFDDDQGMLIESQETPNIDADSSVESLGFDTGFDAGFDAGDTSGEGSGEGGGE